MVPNGAHKIYGTCIFLKYAVLYFSKDRCFFGFLTDHQNKSLTLLWERVGVPRPLKARVPVSSRGCDTPMLFPGCISDVLLYWGVAPRIPEVLPISQTRPTFLLCGCKNSPLVLILAQYHVKTILELYHFLSFLTWSKCDCKFVSYFGHHFSTVLASIKKLANVYFLFIIMSCILVLSGFLPQLAQGALVFCCKHLFSVMYVPDSGLDTKDRGL